jgi:hypothetical protein
VRNSLLSAQLLPEQIGEISEDRAFKTPLARPPIEQSAVTVRLRELNTLQIVDIGKRLQTLGSNVKMMGMEIQARREKGSYFDVVYKLVSFYFPMEEPPPEPAARGRGNRRPPPPPAEGE